MDSIGFQIFDIVELHHKHTSVGSGVLFQVDFVFVRKDSVVSKNVDKLVKQV